MNEAAATTASARLIDALAAADVSRRSSMGPLAGSQRPASPVAMFVGAPA